MNELPGLSADRLKRAIFAFVRELFPQQDYFGFYLYSVAEWDNGSQTGSLIPQSTTVGLPQIGRVPVRLPGLRVDLPVGQEVLVGFDNHDPTRPYIAHLGTLGTGLAPSSITVDASGLINLGVGASKGVARLDDGADAGTLVFTPNAGLAPAVLTYLPPGVPPVPPVAVPPVVYVPLSAVINEASTKVRAS